MQAREAEEDEVDDVDQARHVKRDATTSLMSSDTRRLRCAQEVLNPAACVSYHAVREGVEVMVVRDDLLEAGTKQRGLAHVLLTLPATEFVYAGASSGFAQLALPLCARLCNKRATVVLPAGTEGPTTLRARMQGARVVPVPRPNTLDRLQQAAEAYVVTQNEKHGPGYAQLLPFGLALPSFEQGLETALREALPRRLLLDEPPRRLWVAAGSCTLLRVLRRLFPRSTLLAVQVGKELRALPSGDVQTFVAPEKFWERATQPPPYPSVPSYDAKIWQFVLHHAQDGDCVWNVAAERPVQEPVKTQDGKHGDNRPRDTAGNEERRVASTGLSRWDQGLKRRHESHLVTTARLVVRKRSRSSESSRSPSRRRHRAHHRRRHSRSRHRSRSNSSRVNRRNRPHHRG